MHGLSKLSSIAPGMDIPGLLASGLIRFSLDGVSERERPAQFREFFGRGVIRYDIEPLRHVPIHADLTLQAWPGLMMMSGRAYGSCNKRTREMLALDATDDIGLIVNLKGTHRITLGEEELILGNGEATLMSLDAVCSYTHSPPGDILALRAPRKELGPLLTGVDDYCFRRIPRDTPALSLLKNYVTMVRDEQTAASCALQHLVVNHIYDLMALVVGATRDAAELAKGRGLRAARLHAIKQDIASNLDRADLSVAMLAARHRCTPRYVQRLFEMEGSTFTEYLLAQRLARAYHMLLDPRRDGEKISTVAHECGFGDVSYFNRAFRRRYAASPSDLRAQVQRDASGGIGGKNAHASDLACYWTI
jgi:AraC-like DNA-binding protein